MQRCTKYGRLKNIRWKVRCCKRVDEGAREECRCWILRQSPAGADAENDQSVACSYSKVENYIPVTIHFNHVLEFGIGNHAYGSRQRCSKFQYHAHTALSQQTKVVVFAKVGSQVERIQRVSVAVVFATNKQTFVSALSSSSGMLLYTAIGHMDNDKVPTDSVVVPEESLRHRGSSRTNLQVPVLRLKSLKFSKILHSADKVW